jgi:hypothetical protein
MPGTSNCDSSRGTSNAEQGQKRVTDFSTHLTFLTAPSGAARGRAAARCASGGCGLDACIPAPLADHTSGCCSKSKLLLTGDYTRNSTCSAIPTRVLAYSEAILGYVLTNGLL